MAKTAYLSVRLEPDVKTEAEEILSRLGLSTSEAITIFLKQVALHKGVPFPLRIPNDETRAALNEDPHNLPGYDDAGALLDDILNKAG